jgi:iron complex outermembrane receptor protein
MKLYRSVIIATAALMAVSASVYAEEMEEIVVEGSLGSLPGEDVSSIFGFDKSLLETPRSASTVSSEMMGRFNMYDIDELIALAPGTFTQSFFGVAGSLDIRGTPGETYFRGVRRLDNPGNYPTPIGASDRVDIIRGPASPIYGPAKMGGYLNFNPKSARIEENGQFIPDTIGSMSYTTGDWNKSVLTAEVGGPAEMAGRAFGYYLYGEVENSGSYYQNTETQNTLLQGSFDTDWSDRVQLQFGGMYHDYTGNQVAGWNRLTQDLIDNGTYTTGLAVSLDTNGDGRISHQEYDVDGDGFASDVNPFRWDFIGPESFLTPGTDETIDELEILTGDLSLMALFNVGTARLDGSQVLVAPEDTLENEVTTLYFDVIYDGDDGWVFTNKLFYESYESVSESAYGFSQFNDTWVIEDKLIISKVFEGDGLTTSIQLSPSIRITDFAHADDWSNEYFDRRDLTLPSTSRDKRWLATTLDDDYTEYYVGDYTDIGLAALADFSWDFGLNAVIGVRWDTIDMQSSVPVDKLLLPSSNYFCFDESCVIVNASDDFSGVSWSLSVSYDTDAGIIPYITASEQSTVIAGQGSDISTSNIVGKGAFDSSELMEIGIKGSLIENALYVALSLYTQERTDFSAQSITVNQATETEGTEFEVRWVVNEQLLLTFGYSRIEVVNLTTQAAGSTFSFIGADDLPNIAPELLYGGALIGEVSLAPSGARRAGMPENIISITGTYDFGNGLAVSGSIVDVDSVPSGFSNSVTLPAYTLVNLSLLYETNDWAFSLSGKNLTDERYFRSNFPNLFGSVIVLPELPRHFQARIQRNF